MITTPFDPTLYPKLIEWLRTKDPLEPYTYHSIKECALAQFGRHLVQLSGEDLEVTAGDTYYTTRPSSDDPWTYHNVVRQWPAEGSVAIANTIADSATFGELLQRLEALDIQPT